ncbi:MAG: protein kinase [Acidobacteriota bacterium]
MKTSNRSFDSAEHSFKEAERLFFLALELPVAERLDFVAASTAHQPELRADLEALLASDARQSSDPEASLSEVGRRLQDLLLAEAIPGNRLGPFRLERELGAGGFGRVFLARRVDDPETPPVAIKLIRKGMDSELILSRFRREKEILSSLAHPHIARLSNAAAAPGGQPYLVMEYVDGERIDVYCRHHRLPLRERLHLFLQVCSGVAHAHRNLIVHRDLKPGNILVDREGRPKLLDFGTAKLLSSDETLITITATEQRMLTPGYASPEQIEGRPASTSVDVFTLGVLLYELVADQHPFHQPDQSRSELLRRVREDEPAAPSTIRRRAGLPGHADLDAIIAKALRKDAHLRYGSVVELAADVERFLASRPVAARKGTWRYRTFTFVRRHRWILAASATLATMLALFVVALGQERSQALEARDRAEVVSAYLRGLFLDLDPFSSHSGPLSVADLLDNGRRFLDEGRADDNPELQVMLLRLMAELNGSVGRRDQAVGLLDDARALVPTEDSSVLGLLAADVGGHHVQLGNFELAETALDTAIRLLEAEDGEARLHYGRALGHRGGLSRHRGEYEEARGFLEAALEVLGERHGDAEVQGDALLELALVAQLTNDSRRGVALVERVLDLWQNESISPAKQVQAREVLVTILGETGEFPRALEISEEILEIRRRHLPADHPSFIASDYNLGVLAHRSGDLRAAEGRFRGCIDRMRSIGDGGHPELAPTLLWLGRVLLDQGRPSDAAPLIEESITVGTRRFGQSHEFIANAVQILGEAQWWSGEIAAASATLRDAERIMDSLDVVRGDRRAKLHALLADLAMDQQDLIESRRALGCPHLVRVTAEQEVLADPWLLAASARHAWLAGDRDLAPEHFRSLERVAPRDASEEIVVRTLLVEWYLAVEEVERARALADSDWAIFSGHDAGLLSLGWIRWQFARARALAAGGETDEARALMESVLPLLPPPSNRPLLGGTDVASLLAELETRRGAVGDEGLR